MDLSVPTPNLFINLLMSCTFILFATLIESYQNIHLPPIVIETLQSLSYLGAFVVACFTVYNFISKRKTKKK